MELTAEQARARSVRAMGQELGETYEALWQEIVWLHSKWAEYAALYGTKESRVTLLNRAAPRFARLLQDTLWEDVVLHIARLTDPPKSAGKHNLTVQRLATHLGDSATRTKVEGLVARAIEQAEFCRDWRNRHLAHRDLHLALARGAEPPKAGSRQSVREVLQTLGQILDAVSSRYIGSTTYFELDTDAGGALSLLCVLDDGLKMERDARNPMTTSPETFSRPFRCRPTTGCNSQHSGELSMHCHRAATTLGAIMSMLLTGCAQQPDSNPCPATGARIFVTSAGIVSLNGSAIEVGALRDALAALSPTPTVVCYSRDDAAGEPSPAATQAVDAIIQLRLPVAFYTDGTFNTVVKME